MTAFPLTESATLDLSSTSTLRDYERIAEAAGIRKISLHSEEIPRDGGAPLLRVAVCAVIRNPWLDTGSDEDLDPETQRIAPLIAKLLIDRLLDAFGDPESIEAFGKAALVGLAGETEHAGALIHTPYFGNLIREALEGTSIICFVDGRSDAGAALRVPMWHKTAAATRSHYQSFDISLTDAPHPEEIVVIAAASSGPRPHARIGDRTTDHPVTSAILKEIVL